MKQISIKERLVSMTIDHVAMTGLMMVLFLPASVYFHITHPAIIGQKYYPVEDSPLLFYAGTFVISLYFNKDSVFGRSIGKRILGLQVIDIRSGKPATPIQCLIRNLTILIWPVEVIFAIANTRRRLGDFIARTQLVYFDKALHQSAVRWFPLALSLAVTFFGIILMTNYFGYT